MADKLARRRRQACSGVVPGRLAQNFTQGETAALSVIGRQIQMSGRCALPIDAIAALSGCSPSTVRNALVQAKISGIIHVRYRPRKGLKNLTNVITVMCAEWKAWLKLGSTGSKNFKPLNNKDFLSKSHGPRLAPAAPPTWKCTEQRMTKKERNPTRA